MKKWAALVILIMVIAGVVKYEKTKCRDDAFTSCKIQKETYEDIVTGASFDAVLKILGNKNMNSVNPTTISTCGEADSAFSWISHKSNNTFKSSIVVGFKGDKVICKAYFLGKQG